MERAASVTTLLAVLLIRAGNLEHSRGMVSQISANLHESPQFPTGVMNVMTLLVKSRRPISDTTGVRFTRGMSSVSLASKRRLQPAFPRVFDLTNRVRYGHVCRVRQNVPFLTPQRFGNGDSVLTSYNQ